MDGSCNLTKSRNKVEGKYKAYRFGKHFRSLNKLIGYVADDMGNPFFHGPTKVIK